MKIQGKFYEEKVCYKYKIWKNGVFKINFYIKLFKMLSNFEYISIYQLYSQIINNINVVLYVFCLMPSIY